MGLTIKQEGADIGVMEVTGLLKKSEMDAVQAEAAKKLAPSAAVKLMIILKDFEGWDSQGDWGDLTFYSEHGDKIIKIAIVGDPKWETEFKMFVGAGFRLAPVKFFPSSQLAQARAWLSE